MRLREGEKKSRRLRRPCGHGKEKRQSFFFSLLLPDLALFGPWPWGESGCAGTRVGENYGPGGYSLSAGKGSSI